MELPTSEQIKVVAENIPNAPPSSCIANLATPPAQPSPAPVAQPVNQMKAIDTKKCKMILLTHPDNSVTCEQLFWIASNFPLQNIVCFDQEGQVDIIRNISVESFIAPELDKFEWFVFMDRDMRPDAATNPFLEDVPGDDIVACQYPIPNMRGWSMPTGMHMGLVRIHSRVFKKLLEDKKLPVFMFARNEANTQVTSCECNWFATRAQNAGFKIRRAGWCEHFKKRSEKK